MLLTWVICYSAVVSPGFGTTVQYLSSLVLCSLTTASSFSSFFYGTKSFLCFIWIFLKLRCLQRLHIKQNFCTYKHAVFFLQFTSTHSTLMTRYLVLHLHGSTFYNCLWIFKEFSTTTEHTIKAFCTEQWTAIITVSVSICNTSPALPKLFQRIFCW